VSFFEAPPPVDPPPFEPVEHKPWWGPPPNELGVSVPLRSVLARTEELVVALLDAVAYTTGLSFRLTVKRRREPPDSFDAWFRDPLGLHERFSSGDALPDDLLRLGVLFSDGRKATTTGGVSTFGRTERPSGPVLTPGDSSGGGGEWESTLWLWPLPPAGPLALVVEWPSEGIEETRQEVEAQPLLDAGRASERLWPDEGGSGGSAQSSLSFRR
jgi:hypothetical protein